MKLNGRVILAESPNISKGADNISTSKDDAQSEYEKSVDIVSIPRDLTLAYNTFNGLQVSRKVIRHGGAETQFIAVFETFTKPKIQIMQHVRDSNIVTSIDGQSLERCVILSADTDVFIILLLAECMQIFWSTPYCQGLHTSFTYCEEEV